MKDVQQKNCSAGIQTVFTMSLRRSQFLVKNFTDNQIIIASIFQYDIDNINVIEIKERLINELRQ